MSIQPLGGPQAHTSPPSPATGDARAASVPPPQSTTVANSSPPAPQRTDAPRPVSEKELQEAVGRIKDFIEPINDSIQFSLDEDTGRTIVKVIDLQTKEVLRQIPSEEVLNIAKALDKLQGLLIRSTA